MGLERETTVSPLAALEASAATARVVVVAAATEETVALVEVRTRFPIVTWVLFKFKDIYIDRYLSIYLSQYREIYIYIYR